MSNIKSQQKSAPFAQKAATSLWQEQPDKDNPYLAANCRLRGYALMDLVKERSFIDTLYLLMLGKLPSKPAAELLEALMIGLINPGPRHPATRAVMYAGIGKTNHEHILPIGLMTLGGSFLGAKEVEKSISFLYEHTSQPPHKLAETLLPESMHIEGDQHIAPGFGTRFGDIDPIPNELASYLASLPGAGESLAWGCCFVEQLAPHNIGWLATGVAAAVFADLGIGAREGAGLFQLLGAPGILAHGLEQTHKPISAMPLLPDDRYNVETK